MRPDANWPNSSWPNFSWKEIELLAGKTAPELEGLFLDRLVVPARPEHPQGYLKGEWALRFTGRKSEATLLLSVRPRHPYFALLADRGPQAAAQATHSPFDLAVSKHLRGLKLTRFWVPHRERIVALDFEGGLRLVLLLIPSMPEALLVKVPGQIPNKPESRQWPVIARSRTIRPAPADFDLPDGARAPENPPVRAEMTDPKQLRSELESWLEREAFSLRVLAIEKSAREKLKVVQDRLRQSEVARGEAREEPDWQRYGDLLKSAIGSTPESGLKTREITDYETGEKISVPCDPKLSLRAQIEKFYNHARRKQRRFSEATSRIESFTETLHRLEGVASQIKGLGNQPASQRDWKTLERLESLSGKASSSSASPGSRAAGKSKTSWLGRSAQSKDGWPIWIGKSRDENLELTFKHARGNDLWMHVRGRPGAHVVIPVQPGKSVPLETLLDAANLVIFFSGGESWGKTEVDYAFKKHVKRIKDSTEASYTHNKTLIVEPDRARLKRLLGEKT